MIPIIPENLLNSLVNTVEDGEDYAQKAKCDEIVNKGLYAMSALYSLSVRECASVLEHLRAYKGYWVGSYIDKKHIAKLKKKYNKRSDTELEPILEALTFKEIYEYAGQQTMLADTIKAFCKDICKECNVDSDEFDLDFGKATGGGSTYVGWGSSRAVGIGLGLSAISAMKASSKRDAINRRIKYIEAYAMYNGVAQYFNECVLPGIDGKLLSDLALVK